MPRTLENQLPDSEHGLSLLRMAQEPGLRKFLQPLVAWFSGPKRLGLPRPKWDDAKNFWKGIPTVHKETRAGTQVPGCL